MLNDTHFLMLEIKAMKRALKRQDCRYHTMGDGITDEDRRGAIRDFFDPEPVEDYIVEHVLGLWNDHIAFKQAAAKSLARALSIVGDDS